MMPPRAISGRMPPFTLGRLADAWQCRARGLKSLAPDWITPEALHWAGIAVDAPDELLVGLRAGVPARALPRFMPWGRNGRLLRVRALPGQPALAQGSPGIQRAEPPSPQGVASCLVRDRLSPDRNYVVTCGHVLAPDKRVAWGDDVMVSIGAAGLTLRARLREWQPAVCDDTPPTDLDAGLAEIDVAAVNELLRQAPDWLPVAISDSTPPNREVVLKRQGADLPGAVKLHWAGQVELPDAAAGTYFLRHAVGCATAEPTVGGDSGAPIWTTDESLLGLHIGAIDPDVSAGANAVFGRIAPVLDWFQVKAYTRGDPATIEPGPPRSGGLRLEAVPAAGLLNAGSDDTLIVAKTLWGEARGEGPDGMKAVANVIFNRLARRHRGCETPAEVCLDPKQFSCWNTSDPNRGVLAVLGPTSLDAQFATALAIASAAVRGALPDATFGALHYVSRHLQPRPRWLVGQVPCVVIGNHEFYNRVR